MPFGFSGTFSLDIFLHLTKSCRPTLGFSSVSSRDTLIRRLAFHGFRRSLVRPKGTGIVLIHTSANSCTAKSEGTSSINDLDRTLKPAIVSFSVWSESKAWHSLCVLGSPLLTPFSSKSIAPRDDAIVSISSIGSSRELDDVFGIVCVGDTVLR